MRPHGAGGWLTRASGIMIERTRAFLIDGTACCYRAFYAVRDLRTSSGRPTNAVYGVAAILKAIVDRERPAYLAVAFDSGKPTFRHAQFERYKIKRQPMPEALVGQLPLVKRLLSAHRIAMVEKEGYEGEDLLATLAKPLVARGIDVVLVTGDKDVLQLVNSHLSVYNPQQDGALLDAVAVRDRYGVEPKGMLLLATSH